MIELTETIRGVDFFFKYLSFNDIMCLSQVSKQCNEIVGSSDRCMKKIQLSLTKRNDLDFYSHVECLSKSMRRYQNIFINCCGDSEASEIFVRILKRFERSVVDLNVMKAAYRWDMCNTRKFDDKMLVLTDLKHLKIASSNDHLTEILFISCTYLDSLIVVHVRLNKYFHYCLQVNEKLKVLKIFNPRSIYDDNPCDHFNFKLNQFEFRLKQDFNVRRIDFLRKIIMPLVKNQLKHVKFMLLETVTLTNIMDILSFEDFVNPRSLKVFVNDETLTIKADGIEMTGAVFSTLNHYYSEFLTFIDRNCGNLEKATLSGIEDQEVFENIMKIRSLKTLSVGSSSGDLPNLISEKISRLTTTATNLEEIAIILRFSPNLKSLRVFEVTKELLDVVSQDTLLIEYHFIHPDCLKYDKEFSRVNTCDPFMRIPIELHELIIQHLDDSFAYELSKTWTTFDFNQLQNEFNCK